MRQTCYTITKLKTLCTHRNTAIVEVFIYMIVNVTLLETWENCMIIMRRNGERMNKCSNLYECL